MGSSSNHASSVGLTRNPQTGYISPQFHMVYDNLFKTVMEGYDENEAAVNHVWDNLANTQREHDVEHSEGVDPIPALHSD